MTPDDRLIDFHLRGHTMKKLTRIVGIVLTFALAAPALAVGGSGGPDRPAAATFAPRDDGDNTTDTSPPPEDDGVTDPIDDPGDGEPPAENPPA